MEDDSETPVLTGATIDALKRAVERLTTCYSYDVRYGDDELIADMRKLLAGQNPCHCQWEAGDSPCPRHDGDET